MDCFFLPAPLLVLSLLLYVDEPMEDERNGLGRRGECAHLLMKNSQG